MTASQQIPSGDAPPGAGAAPLRMFINYRRSDTGGYAWALYLCLTSELDGVEVFFDGASLPPGVEWFEEIKHHAAGAGGP